METRPLGSKQAPRPARRTEVLRAGRGAEGESACHDNSDALQRRSPAFWLNNHSTTNYTWPGSNWRPSACWADVIATRPQVLLNLAAPQSLEVLPTPAAKTQMGQETYTWPGSNWRPSACEADVIATRPQVLCQVTLRKSPTRRKKAWAWHAKTLPGRLELPTLRLTASRSNQLSYGSRCVRAMRKSQASANQPPSARKVAPTTPRPTSLPGGAPDPASGHPLSPHHSSATVGD